MCSYEGEAPKLHHASSPVARKRHGCEECGRTIAAGEQYERVRALYDGRWFTCATCVQCVAAREWLSVVCNGWLYGGVAEDLREHLHEGGYESVGLLRLVAGIRRKWRWRAGELASVEVVRGWRHASTDLIPAEARGWAW